MRGPSFRLSRLGVSNLERAEVCSRRIDTAMTSIRNPPFRAEQLGSLLRPDALLQKRYDVASGKASQSELQQLEDEAVKDIVKLQQECGFHGIGDGEFR